MPRLRFWLGGIFLSLLSCRVAAIEQIQLDLGLVESDSWRVSNAYLTIDWSNPDGSVLTVQIPRIDFNGKSIRQVTLTCHTFSWLRSELGCRQGRLSFSSEWLNANAVPASLHYATDSGQLNISLQQLPLAKGNLNFTFRYQDGNWHTDIYLQQMNIAALAALVRSSGAQLPDLQLQGKVEGNVSLQGNQYGLEKAGWQLSAVESAYSNEEGTQAAEELQLASSGMATGLQKRKLQIESEIEIRNGMLYSDPVYLEFSPARPLLLSSHLEWNRDEGRIRIVSLDFNQLSVMNGNLQALVQLDKDLPLQSLDVYIQQSWMPGLYESWIQPWLAGTVLEQLDTGGKMQGEFHLASGQPQSLKLKLDEVSLREPAGLFGVDGVNAALEWSDNERTNRSRLTWQSANVYRLTFGAATLPLEIGRRHLKVEQPVVTQFLDGQLHVEEFELGLDDNQDLHWLLDGMITPVSMQTFSTAVGWTPLSGTLSGMVPHMRYEQGVLTLGGILLVQAFNGDITVRNLRIEKPLSLVPRLWADTRLEGIDLKTLTRTFSFGRIEGTVRGALDGLYMEAWQPVAFDAYLETPSDDRSRHRISQKAVDNISDLGGAGMSGAMSRGFLRVFEDFRYQRLGIRCRLENSICHMDGVEPADDGYYLVKGGLIPPRLDVIGHNREVDWPSLLDRLVNITRGEGPRIE